jgi:hypothetical protein
MLDICSVILLLAPIPMESMAITAPTPIMIPSMVSADRILFLFNALNEIRIAVGMSIMSCQSVRH